MAGVGVPEVHAESERGREERIQAKSRGLLACGVGYPWVYA